MHHYNAAVVCITESAVQLVSVAVVIVEHELLTIHLAVFARKAPRTHRPNALAALSSACRRQRQGKAKLHRLLLDLAVLFSLLPKANAHRLFRHSAVLLSLLCYLCTS